MMIEPLENYNTSFGLSFFSFCELLKNYHPLSQFRGIIKFNQSRNFDTFAKKLPELQMGPGPIVETRLL